MQTAKFPLKIKTLGVLGNMLHNFQLQIIFDIEILLSRKPIKLMESVQNNSQETMKIKFGI